MNGILRELIVRGWIDEAYVAAHTVGYQQLAETVAPCTLDRAAGTLRIAWQGSATVVFYSGASFFYLSDPVLEVANGKGTITATLSGFGSDQADQSQWSAVPDTEVTVGQLQEPRR